MSRLTLLNQISELCFRMNPSWTRTSSDKELEQYLVDGIKETERELQETKALLLLANAELAAVTHAKDVYFGSWKRTEAELAEVKDSMAYRTSLIGRTEKERNDLKAELAALKAKAAAPDWMASSSQFAERAYLAGWRDLADAQHEGIAAMYDELIAAAPAQPQDHACHAHPDAPHGFNRNASHTADRYVCDCEGWVPPTQQQSDAVIVPRELANRLVSTDNHVRQTARRELRNTILGGEA